MPKVSIVLPTYNGERFLREAIDSVINQTFTDWELIIVNDCSTDRTQEIIEYYEKIDERIKTIRNYSNKKLPESLNIGFRVAKGDFFTWTSDDNIFLPTALEEMVSFLENNLNSYIVCARMQIIDEKGGFLRMHPEYNEIDMLYNDCVGACFMYRCCVIRDVGEYDTNRFLVEDYDYWLRILFYYGKIYTIDRTLYKYREHENSLTGKRAKEIYQQLIKLKRDYINNIMDKCNYRKDIICNIYYELKFGKMLDNKLAEKCKRICSEINMEVKLKEKEKIIVYGAGKYGNMAYQKYKEQIVFYADSNREKIGRYLNGIRIISIEALKKYKETNKVSILIASYPQNIYSFINTLKSYGINEYSIFYC